MSSSPKLIARGQLASEPLATLLVRLYDSQLSGTLILQTPDGHKNAVLFSKGAPAKARVEDNPVYLGEVLVDLGLVDRRVSARARKSAVELNKTHGRVLLDQGSLDETGLYVALREQLHRQVLSLCDMPESTGFGFYQANYLASWGDPGTWRVKPLPLLWRALVERLPMSFRENILNMWGEREVRLRAEAPVRRYGMTAVESAVINMIRAKAMPLMELEGCGVGNVEEVRRVVSALVISRQLHRDGEQKPPVGFSEPPETPNSVAPPTKEEAARARRSIDRRTQPRAEVHEPRGPQTNSPDQEELRQLFSEFEARKPVTHYDVLQVDKDATVPQVRAAFFQLARLWHPDRLPSELADMKSFVTSSFAKMTEAHQVLADPQQRSEYDARLNEVGEEEQEQVAIILNAASAFQRAEVFLKKKNYGDALREAQAAFDADPVQSEYKGLYAWLLSFQAEPVFGEILMLLDEALEADPSNVTVRWYRGQALKKSGKVLKAQADFKKILELRPSHMDAAREIRVFRMRKRSDAGSPSSKGLFGRFKK
ncbi:MAG: DnaJ domain-containing protein [Polyangiaceae bacterium]|nr:DnaJ domain-containing protein [Polyangiaceae bacterium]